MKFLTLFVCLTLSAFHVGNAASIPAAPAPDNSLKAPAHSNSDSDHPVATDSDASAQSVSAFSPPAPEDPACQTLKGKNVEGKNSIRWFDCTGLSDGDYPHPVEPTKFITCVNGVYAWESECAGCDTNPRTCPTGLLVFNAEQNMCVYSNCVTTPQPQNHCEDGKAKCQDVGGLHLDCATKYEYINPDKNRGKLVEMSCRHKGADGLELVWDQKAKLCQSCDKVFKKNGAPCCSQQP